MADRSNRREGRDRYDRDNRQAEQFDSNDHSWRDEERGYGQMGDTAWRQDEPSDYSSASRNREASRGRQADYGRDFNRDQTTGARSGYGQSRYEREAPGFGSFTSNDYGGSDFSAPRYTNGSSYGAGSRLAQGRGEWHEDDRSSYRARSYGDREDRGWFERAGDEVASWFGDDDAARRREQDYSGHGPSGYTRSDERILEDANDELTDDWAVDARKIQVTVSNGEVTLDGTVPSRDQKRRAEDCVENLSGVKHVQNNLRVEDSGAWTRNNSADTGTTGAA